MNMCRVLSTLCSVLGTLHTVEAVLFCMVFAASPVNICRVLCQNTQEPTLWQIFQHHLQLPSRPNF